MAYWLVKSEPFVYSWEDLQKEGRTSWEGVRNYAARNHLKAMKAGDEVLFYHSNEGMAVVGIARVAREHYPDPTTEEDAWVTVDLQPLRKLERPVPLKLIKAEPRLNDMALLRQSRLSVSPVSEAEWKVILELSALGTPES